MVGAIVVGSLGGLHVMIMIGSSVVGSSVAAGSFLVGSKESEKEIKLVSVKFYRKKSY